MTLEEKIKEFKYCVACDLHDQDIELVLEFSSYWTEYSPGAKKARWEKEKVFDIKKRFATWKRNAEKWNKQKTDNPTFKEQVIKKTEAAVLQINKWKIED